MYVNVLIKITLRYTPLLGGIVLFQEYACSFVKWWYIFQRRGPLLYVTYAGFQISMRLLVPILIYNLRDYEYSSSSYNQENYNSSTITCLLRTIFIFSSDILASEPSSIFVYLFLTFQTVSLSVHVNDLILFILQAVFLLQITICHSAIKHLLLNGISTRMILL